MAKKIVIGNWKMNPETLIEAKKIVSIVGRSIPMKTDVIFCPPTIFFSSLYSKKYNFGLQNVFFEEKGAFTGEISVGMAKNMGAKFVIVGHSERRALGENDLDISKKVQAVLKEKMTPILCVGERERDAQGEYINFLKEQIKNSLSGVSKNLIKEIIIAYEPVWAIGKESKDAMNADILHQTAILIRKILVDEYGNSSRGIRIIYGGSVAPENAREIVEKGEVDGLLVGHQSLVPQNFKKILEEISKI